MQVAEKLDSKGFIMVGVVNIIGLWWLFSVLTGQF
jgi:hypothetical protein